MNVGSNYLNAGVEGRRWGTQHESVVPYQAFKTKDGRYFTVGAANDEQFKKVFYSNFARLLFFSSKRVSCQ